MGYLKLCQCHTASRIEVFPNNYFFTERKFSNFDPLISNKGCSFVDGNGGDFTVRQNLTWERGLEYCLFLSGLQN